MIAVRSLLRIVAVLLAALIVVGTTIPGVAVYGYDAPGDCVPSDVRGRASATDELPAGLEAVRPPDAQGAVSNSTSTTPALFFVAPTSAADDLLSAACRTNSFVPGTEVLMADGTAKPIEDIEIGDWVWAADPITGEAAPRRVIDTIVGDGDKHLVDIDILGDTITATDGHPFWVDDEGSWVEAGDLEVGDHLLLPDGSTATVSAASDRAAVGRVHNLTIEGIHTYFVEAGDDAVLVHNCTIGDKIRGQMADRGWTDDLVNEVVDNPTFTHNVWDLTTDSAAPAYARGTTSTWW